jgi:hypothetical protein
MRRLVSAVAGLAVMGMLMGSIDPAVFECEEAVAHLKDCCGDTAAVDGITCGSGCTNVDYSGNNAHCIRVTSCDDLLALDACNHPEALECK